MNKKFFLFILASAGVIISAFLLLTPKSQPIKTPEISPTPEVNLQNAKLTIDYGENNASNYELDAPQDLTAFSLLKTISEKENIALVTEQYDFGIFVKSIDGKESSAEMAWIYFVNGESGTVAADLYKLKPGDVVEWQYIKPE